MDAKTKLADAVAEYASRKLLEWYEMGRCAGCNELLSPSIEFQVVIILGGETHGIIRCCSPLCLSHWSSRFSARSTPMISELAAQQKKAP